MGYLKSLYHDRNIIIQLAKNDFKVKYLGSYLGIFWAFFNFTKALPDRKQASRFFPIQGKDL